MKKRNRKNAGKRTASKTAPLSKSTGSVEFKENSNGIELTEAYVMRGSAVIDSASQRRMAKLKKGMTGSTQTDAIDETEEITESDHVTPPYNPDVLSKFLDVDVVHFRCVSTKVTDSIGRKYAIVAREGVDEESKEFKDEQEEVLDFIQDSNNTDGFLSAIEKADLDLESIGWGCLEVVRSMDKKIRHLYHVPAKRVRALRGFRGFVESNYASYSNDTDANPAAVNDAHTYYLPFGQKVLSPTRKKLDGTFESYNPRKDGDISKGQWNLKSKADLTKNAPITKSANELIFIKKNHPKSIYYGVPDFIPAIGAIRGNLDIRDFFFQYFQHNAVPQYAVIVKGAHLKDDVKEMIQEYFATHVKGQAHSTLVIPIPASAGGDVEVKFERLSAETKEGSFQETKKNNQKDIIVAHGMTPAIIGIVEGSSLGAGKGTAQNEVYKNRVVVPRQEKWQKIITGIFQLGLGATKTTIEFDDLDIADKREQRENIVAYVQDGIMNRNEARKQAKLGPPIKGGERFVIIRGGTPIFVDELDPDEQEALEKKRMDLIGTKFPDGSVNTKTSIPEPKDSKKADDKKADDKKADK